MFEFCSLGSGSSGNASFLRLEDQNILIDAGLSLKKIEEGLYKINQNPKKIAYLFITHAHSDHAKSATNFAIKYQIPIFATKETIAALKIRDPKLNQCTVKFFEKEFKLANSIIKVLRLPHTGHQPDGKDDAGGNVGFIFELGTNFKFSYFTDLGTFPEKFYPLAADSTFYFIEANHDVGWQKASRRPPHIIERNLSDFGHLSNEQTGKILARLIKPEKHKRRTREVMLAHLSKECNSHVLAEKTIREELAKNNIYDLPIKIAPEGRLSERLVLC